MKLRKKLGSFKREIVLGLSKKTKLWRVFYALNKKKIQVILYHNISPEKPVSFKGLGPTMHLNPNLFREHLTFLKQYFHFLKPTDLELLRDDNLEIEDFDKPPILLNFDDGFKGVYNYAFPICKELEVPFIVFVNSSFVNNKDKMWLLVLSIAIQRGKKEHFVRLCRERGYDNFNNNDHIDDLRRKSIRYFRGEDAAKIAQALYKVLVSEGLVTDSEMNLFMSAEQLKEIDTTAGYRVSDHGARHLKLKDINEQLLHKETDYSKKKLVKILGRKVNSFSFPFARYGQSELNYLQEQYSFIFIGGWGGNNRGSNKPSNGNSWTLTRGYSVRKGDSPIDIMTSLYL